MVLLEGNAPSPTNTTPTAVSYLYLAPTEPQTEGVLFVFSFRPIWGRWKLCPIL